MTKITQTDRGFTLVEFIDAHGNQCSLQESSATVYDAIWFGIKEPEINVMIDGGWKSLAIPEGAVINSRMHLTQKQVRALLPALERFARDGTLPDQDALA